MEWARLYLDHRFLQMMHAQYIPSLWFITTIPNDGFLIKDRSTRLMKTLMTWRTSFFSVRAPPIFFAEIFFLKETFGERGKSCSFDKNKFIRSRLPRFASKQVQVGSTQMVQSKPDQHGISILMLRNYRQQTYPEIECAIGQKKCQLQQARLFYQMAGICFYFYTSNLVSCH